MKRVVKIFYQITKQDEFTALNLAKDKVIKHVRAQTSLLIDTPTSAGGNTNTGPLAKQWFSPELRDQICSVIDDPVDREGYLTVAEV